MKLRWFSQADGDPGFAGAIRGTCAVSQRSGSLPHRVAIQLAAGQRGEGLVSWAGMRIHMGYGSKFSQELDHSSVVLPCFHLFARVRFCIPAC